MNKENSNKSANSVRSPYKTRSYTSKTGKKPIDVKTAEKALNKTKQSKTPKSTSNSNATKSTKKITDQKTKKQPNVKICKDFDINSLPSDSLQYIFEYVGVYDTLWNARRVCHKWNDISKKVAGRILQNFR